MKCDMVVEASALMLENLVKESLVENSPLDVSSGSYACPIKASHSYAIGLLASSKVSFDTGFGGTVELGADVKTVLVDSLSSGDFSWNISSKDASNLFVYDVTNHIAMLDAMGYDAGLILCSRLCFIPYGIPMDFGDYAVYNASSRYSDAQCIEYCTRNGTVHWGDEHIAEPKGDRWKEGETIVLRMMSSSSKEYVSLQRVQNSEQLAPLKLYWRSIGSSGFHTMGVLPYSEAHGIMVRKGVAVVDGITEDSDRFALRNGHTHVSNLVEEKRITVEL